MKRIAIPEFGRIYRKDHRSRHRNAGGRVFLAERIYKQLERFDRKWGGESHRIFTWYADHARANQWVGVVHVPGLQLEILPKVDAASSPVDDPFAKEDVVRKNLLYMLAMAGDVPVRARDVARLASRKAPLSETLIGIFAKRLLSELLKGTERNYVQQEENIRAFKGRLLINRHILKNTAHRERFYCHYDEFSEDTPLNRLFKSACRVLLDIATTPLTQDSLRHCLLILDQVQDIALSADHMQEIVLDRRNERFRELYYFCRLILSGHSPTVSAGKQESFSLLFDMNKVFERFIAAFLQKRVMPNMPGYRLFPQARRNRRHLMKTDEEKGVLRLEPDILIRDPNGKYQVIDTKWKNVGTLTERAQGGVSGSDLYQLFAYTHRYGCGQSTLLYPKIPGTRDRDFHILNQNDERCGQRVNVRYVNISRDLHASVERDALTSELEYLVRSGFSELSEQTSQEDQPACLAEEAA